MSDSSTYQFEPELLQPKPRRTTLQDKSGRKGTRVLQILLLGFTVGGLWVLVNAINEAVVMCFGQEVSGRIVAFEDSGRSGGYDVTYTYRVGDHDYTGHYYTGTFDVQRNMMPRLGRIIPVRIAPCWPGWGSKIVSSGTALLGACVFLWFFTLVWTGACAFVWALYLGVRPDRSLFATGDLAVGTITDKLTKNELTAQSQETRYILMYEFVPVSAGLSTSQTVEGTKAVTQEQWKAVNIGDKLTVLYLPNKPQRHELYRFGPYRVSGT